MPRRTPSLTRQVREMFERDFREYGWGAGYIVPIIAKELDLTPQQVRDAIMGETADEWRRAFAAQLQEERNARS